MLHSVGAACYIALLTECRQLKHYASINILLLNGANQIFCGSLTRDAHFVPIGDHLVRAAEDRAWA